MQEAQNSGESLPVTCLNRDVSEQDFSEVNIQLHCTGICINMLDLNHNIDCINT